MRQVFVARKTPLVAALLVWLGVSAFALEGRPTFAALPFVGLEGAEGEAVAALLSSAGAISSAFDVVPVAGEAAAIAADRLFRMGAFACSDMLAEAGLAIGADYVAWGYVRRAGAGGVVVVAAIRVGTLELAGGYHRAFRSVREIRGFAPSMAESLAGAIARGGDADRPTLAIAPVGLSAGVFGVIPPYLAQGLPAEPEGAEALDLMTLAQILAVEIANTGKYSVLPRASSMRAALAEWETRMVDERAAAMDRLIDRIMGIIDGPNGDAPGHYDEGPVTAMARAVEADFALFAETRAFGDASSFAARLQRARDGALLRAASEGHRGLRAGAALMARVAALLTEPEPGAAAARIAALDRDGRRARLFADSARFWSVGASIGSSFTDPWVIGTLNGSAAPFPFSFVRLGVDAGFVSGVEGAGYFSLYPHVHLVFFMPFDVTPLPLTGGGLYAGAGGGFMLARYVFDDIRESVRAPMMDFVVGVNVANRIDVSYALRTDFSSANGKLSIGFTHRFWFGGR